MSSITMYRGDSYPLNFTIKDKVSQVVIDLTGAIFVMTVDQNSDPTDSTKQLFVIEGVLDDDPLTGKVSFTPTSLQTAQVPATYWYDVQMVDALGNTRTIVKSEFVISQDIGK